MMGPTNRLVRAELSRLFHRKAIENTFIAVLIAYIVGTISVFALFAPSTSSEAEGARAQQRATVAATTEAYAECVGALAPGRSELVECGLSPEVTDLGNFTQYLVTKTFVLEVMATQLAQLIGLSFAVIAFLVGAMWMGSEWSSGSLSLLATWEPSRSKLLLTKLLALVVVIGLVAVCLQAAWIPTSIALAKTRGIEGPDPVPWIQLLGVQGRLVLLAVVASMAGFAIANLTRSAAGAIGVACGYVLAVEAAVRWLSPTGQAWLVSDNALAFVSPSRYVVSWDVSGELNFIEISKLHAVGGMLLVIAALLFIGGIAFQRRDLA